MVHQSPSAEGHADAGAQVVFYQQQVGPRSHFQAAPVRVSRSATGRYSRTVRVPGTGIYDTRSVGGGRRSGRSRGAQASGSASRSGEVGWDGASTRVASGPAAGSSALSPGAKKGGAGCGCGCLGLIVLALIGMGATQCGHDSSPTGTTTTSSSAPATSASAPPSATTTPPWWTSSAVPPSSSVVPAPPLPAQDSPESGTTALPDPNDSNDDHRPAPLYSPPPTRSRAAAPDGAGGDTGAGTGTGGGGEYFRNCSEARAAGAAPIYAGQPGYSRSLDRDGDGIACDR